MHHPNTSPGEAQTPEMQTADRQGDGRSPVAPPRGASLIEVLITMLVLAVGVLGVVALQFRGLQFNHTALTRSQVNLLADDLIERVRLNPGKANTYVTKLANWKVANVNCNAKTMLKGGTGTQNADVACWQWQAAQKVLPAGSTVQLTGANPFTLTITWNDREQNAHVAAYSFGL